MKIKKKQGLPSSFDNRHSPSNKRNGAPSLVAHRPLKERVIHILALKPYSKPELLLWLEREKASPKDKADLSTVLEEVTYSRLNVFWRLDLVMMEGRLWCFYTICRSNVQNCLCFFVLDL